MPTDHSIWIQHGDHFDDKVSTEGLRPRVVRLGDEIQEPVEDKTSGSFPWVNTTADKVDLEMDNSCQCLILVINKAEKMKTDSMITI